MIYFLQHKETGLIKIGTTSQYRQRLYALKKQYGDMKTLGFIEGFEDVEQQLHQMFSAHNVRDVLSGREWFSPDKSVLNFISANATKKVPYELGTTSSLARGWDSTLNLLDSNQVKALFNFYSGDSLIDIRNQFLLKVAFYTGLKSHQIVHLMWCDIDSDVIRSSDGYHPYFGDTSDSDAWARLSVNRSYVFCGIKKNGQFGDDVPLSAHMLRRIFIQAGNSIGVTNLTPEDARRTACKSLRDNGVSASDLLNVFGQHLVMSVEQMIPRKPMYLLSY